MGLQLEEIKQAIKKPKQSQSIRKAIQHENRIRFHVEAFLEPSDISEPLSVFMNWVKTLIPKDKYAIFVSLFQFPTPIIQLSTTIFGELERVFDGKNPSYNYQFSDPKYKADWESYMQRNLKEPIVWRKKGWDAVKTAINSVMIVDLPMEQEGELPEPYFYWLKICHVIDYDYEEETGMLEWIIFKQEDDCIAIIDEEFYRVVKLDKKGEIVGEIYEKAHNLGYCPAKFFWSDELVQSQPDIKKSPLSTQLGNLDWLLFFSISKKHLDLYAPYPIYSAYEADCDFRNNETLDYCDGGYLRDEHQNYRVQRNGTVEQCPICANKRLAGVGSFIEIPVPVGNGPDLRNPVQITSIDKASLDYNVEEVRRLKTEVLTSVIGMGGDVTNKQSINEMQVTANFESKSSVLNSLKGNLEAIKKFVDDTCCRLRYGDSFLGSSISMGTEFYIFSVNDLYAQYKQAKENGSSMIELDAISDQIIETEHRNNPELMQRMKILKHLEPYRHYTQAEMLALNDKNLLNRNDVKMKINFSTFVDRFERENTNVVEFGSQLPFGSKIDKIKAEFLKYINEEPQVIETAQTNDLKNSVGG